MSTIETGQSVEALKLASELREFSHVLVTSRAIAAASALEALASKVAELEVGEKVRQRLLDLVRHQRAELYEANLISTEEYARLLSEEGSVARLETYDDMRQRIQEMESPSPEKTDWCPTCKQGWDCAKRDQESRGELHAARQRIQTLESQSAAMRSALEAERQCLKALRPSLKSSEIWSAVSGDQCIETLDTALATDAGKDLAQDKAIVDWLDTHFSQMPWRGGVDGRPGWFSRDLCKEFPTFRAACMDAMKAEGAK